MTKYLPIFSMLAGAAAVSLLFGAETANAQEGRGISGKEAHRQIASRLGGEKTRWLAEMSGEKGISQPLGWHVLLHDENAERLMRWFWVDDAGRVQDEGDDTTFYPDKPPTGFFRIEDLKVDSVAAFTIAEAEARRAGVGFDELNYSVRAREFSREPLWTVELIDTRGYVSGQVFISGQNGEVLRTMWIFRDREKAHRDGRPRIVDSASPRGFETTGSSAPQAPIFKQNARDEQSVLDAQRLYKEAEPRAPMTQRPERPAGPPAPPVAKAPSRVAPARGEEIPNVGGPYDPRKTPMPTETLPPLKPEVIPPIKDIPGFKSDGKRIPPPPIPPGS